MSLQKYSTFNLFNYPMKLWYISVTLCMNTNLSNVKENTLNLTSKMKFCFSQNTFFPNTYQGIRSIRSPAKVGIGYYKAVNYQPVVSWRGWETPPQYNSSTVILCMTSNGGQRGRRKGHPTYSLVSIRKNVFWLKQNFICSDEYLPSE